MKYIRLFEERLRDFEIMTMDFEPLINELKKEIEKDDYDLDYIRDLVTYGHFDLNALWYGEDYYGDYGHYDDYDYFYERTFLMSASELGKADIVRVLLEGGADPNVKGLYGKTALHWASSENYLQIVQDLLSHPLIDPNVKDFECFTALMLASSSGRSQMVQALLDHPKTDITITNKRGETAWDVAKPEIREQFPELNPERSER